jgi:hypothetical protein
MVERGGQISNRESRDFRLYRGLLPMPTYTILEILPKIMAPAVRYYDWQVLRSRHVDDCSPKKKEERTGL